MQRAIFLDRDGTLIEDQKYEFRPSQIRFMDGVTDGLKALRQAGYKLVIITNQSGVARGLFGEEQVREMHARLADALADQGVPIDAFYYCPHHVDGIVPEYAVDCECRKPKPGMILEAADDLELDLAASWVIGDICADVEAGCRAGCRTVLVDGNGTELSQNRCNPTYVARNFAQAARLVLSHKPGEANGQGH
ncbi:MAG: D-glycero-alpha-D-manno-heptose-1,7-bisphosphate 7-phosphatase [Chloroflexota bacterium]